MAGVSLEDKMKLGFTSAWGNSSSPLDLCVLDWKPYQALLCCDDPLDMWERETACMDQDPTDRYEQVHFVDVKNKAQKKKKGGRKKKNQNPAGIE